MLKYVLFNLAKCKNIQRNCILLMSLLFVDFNPFGFSITGLSVSKCIINVTQPQDHLYGRLNQSVLITCHINTSCSKTVHSLTWYVFRTDSYYELDIYNHPVKYSLQGSDLHINWLTHSDDGVYHCAAFNKGSTNSGEQAIGTGTKLTVKGKMPLRVTHDVLIFTSLFNLSLNSSWYSENYNVGQVLLFTLVALLFLYILIILTLFICIKVKLLFCKTFKN